jgi:hypothetical protein
MSKNGDLIPVQVKRFGTIYVKSNPRLRRLRAQIGRFVSQKKHAHKLRTSGRISASEFRQRTDSAKERLKTLYSEFEHATRFAVEHQLREITRYSPQTYSGVLFKSGASGGRQEQYHSISAGLPSLGKKR